MVPPNTEAAMRRFFSDVRGNVAIMFALAVVPVFGAMGAAVDYSMANAQKTAMQSAADATALALAKAMPLSQQQLDTLGQQWFQANLGTTPITSLQLAINGTTGQLTITANAIYQPGIVTVLGINQIPVSATAQVKWGSSRLRVALVLDVTGSMNSAGKLSAMKTATVNLLNQLKGAATQNGDVYVSIVPFSKDVAVDPANYNVNWLDWDDWDSKNGTCSISGYSDEDSCEGGQVSGCSKPQYKNKGQCKKNGGTWTKSNGVWTPKAHSTWNGCITDRDQDYDTKNTAPDPNNPATLFPAEQYSSCPDSTMMGLTYDWTALINKINSLQAAGTTNQAIGLQWGWQSLTNSPFTIPAFTAGYTYKQVIILLSDGLNTQDRWYTSASQIDARQAITCNNVKAGGIILYTVQVNTDNDPASTLLKNCATDPGKFYMLTSGSQIITTFNQIATELSNLRLSK
jgi:Flp pilus assembly protein TadG